MLVAPLLFSMNLALADVAMHGDVLARVEVEAVKGVQRGTLVTKTAFAKNVRAMAEVQRTLAGAEASLSLLGEFLFLRATFPTKIIQPAMLPVLVAQQTRVFALFAERAAELRQGRVRHEDWRFTTVGRIIQKLTEDVREELVVVAQRESVRAPYAYEHFAGLTTMARDIAEILTDPVICDHLRAVADTAPAGTGHRHYRAALIAMLGHLRALAHDVDRTFCARVLTH